MAYEISNFRSRDTNRPEHKANLDTVSSRRVHRLKGRLDKLMDYNYNWNTKYKDTTSEAEEVPEFKWWRLVEHLQEVLVILIPLLETGS